jgi:hypothetical protein
LLLQLLLLLLVIPHWWHFQWAMLPLLGYPPLLLQLLLLPLLQRAALWPWSQLQHEKVGAATADILAAARAVAGGAAAVIDAAPADGIA